jgi:pSer/pThr/pTyr-binding forkhead associated (FHA) protein
MKVSLVVVKGKPEGMVVPVEGSQFFIGRDKRCHLRPNNELVSKVHCALKIADDGVTLFDMKSTNGTFVNDRPLDGKTMLVDGDIITVGPLSFAVRIEEPAPVMQSAEPPDDDILAADDGEPKKSSGFSGVMAAWLKEENNSESHAVVGSRDTSEPSLENTEMDMRLDGETREMLAKPPEEAPPEEPVRRLVTPSKPATPLTGAGDTSVAANELLNKYLVRRRDSNRSSR